MERKEYNNNKVWVGVPIISENDLSDNEIRLASINLRRLLYLEEKIKGHQSAKNRN